MSLAVKALGYTKEVEFIAGFTIAEIMADQLQRATVQLKFPNDVLVNDEKISGCIALMNEENYHCPEGRLVNLGVGVNLATKPPADVMRQQGSITAGTCLKEHDVAMDIADFVTLFKAKFRENMNDYRCSHGFETILKRIGFADQNGNIALTSHETGSVVTGTYAGFKTEKIGPKLYKGYILLNTEEGVKPYALQEYSTRAVIKSDAAVGSPHNGTVQADLRIG
jgi:biotin-(acetyl-CoA carboxylase) ligase